MLLAKLNMRIVEVLCTNTLNYYNSIKAHPTALIILLCQTAIKSNELKPVSALAFSTLTLSWSCGRKGIQPVERRWRAAGGDLIGTGCKMIRIIYSCHLRQLNHLFLFALYLYHFHRPGARLALTPLLG